MVEDGGWRRHGSRYLYESRWYNLRQDDLTLPNGESIQYTWIEHPGWVMIVPLRDDGNVVMERIYRHTLSRTVLECPSGGNDGQPPAQAARRELEEETGYRARELTPLGRFVLTAGISDEEVHFFLATGLSQDGEIDRESTEQMEICLEPLETLHAMALRGEIESGPTTLALILAWNHLGR